VRKMIDIHIDFTSKPSAWLKCRSGEQIMCEFWWCCCCLARFIEAGARSSGEPKDAKRKRPAALVQSERQPRKMSPSSIIPLASLSVLTLFLRSRARRRRLLTQSVLDLRARCRVSLPLSPQRQIVTIYCAVCHADSVKMTTSSAIASDYLPHTLILR
jgi:hypothetical protein